MIQERVRKWLRNARENGKRLGRPRTARPLGEGRTPALPGLELVEGFSEGGSAEGHAAAGREVKNLMCRKTVHFPS